MSLLSLFQLNFRRPLVVKPEHAFTAPGRARSFASTAERIRTYAAPGRVRGFTSTAARIRSHSAPARTRDFLAGS